MADQNVIREPHPERERLETELDAYVARTVLPDSVEGLIEVGYASGASTELMSQLDASPQAHGSATYVTCELPSAWTRPTRLDPQPVV